MKKNKAALLVLFAVACNPCFTQTITSQKGLTTAVFNLPVGMISVYLPEDIRQGDVISGTIMAEPTGRNDRQRAKSLSELKKYTVSFNGENFPVKSVNNHFRSEISPKNSADGRLQLLMDKKTVPGKVVEVNIPKISRPTGQAICAIPAHALCAAPMRITGPFDGNAGNTKCMLNNQLLDILAESPGQCVVKIPPGATGESILQVQEKNKPACSQKISGVELYVSTGKTNLLKGETSYVNVELSGLQHLPDTARLTITNTSTAVVIMQPANEVVMLITSENLTNGTYTKRFDLQSIKAGNFIINVDLDLPGNKPPVFADVRAPAGGKRDEKVLTAGTRTALNIAMKKWADANTEGDYPIDFQCESCIQCVKAYTTERNAGDVGELGWGIITSFLSGSLKLAGGVFEKVKEVADKGGDIYKAINDLIADGKIQVIGFKEKWCANNGYCQVTGIIVYDVTTGCAKAEYRCRGSKMCCSYSETTYIMQYCFDKDGAVIDDTISIEIKH